MGLPFPYHDFPADKSNKHFPTAGVPALSTDLAALLLFSQVSRKLYDPKTIAHSCLCDSFPNIQTPQSRNICPKPKRISEDKPTPKALARCLDPHRISEAYARIRSHMPESLAHIRRDKQAHSQKPPERQINYHESIGGSTTSNNEQRCSFLHFVSMRAQQRWKRSLLGKEPGW